MLRTIFFLFVFTVFGTASLEAVAKGDVHSHTIIISAMKFNPESIEVKKGDVIVWKNEDLVPHTVTLKNVFDSGAILPDKGFKKKITRSGHLEYSCTFHPTM